MWKMQGWDALPVHVTFCERVCTPVVIMSPSSTVEPSCSLQWRALAMEPCGTWVESIFRSAPRSPVTCTSTGHWGLGWHMPGPTWSPTLTQSRPLKQKLGRKNPQQQLFPAVLHEPASARKAISMTVTL